MAMRKTAQKKPASARAMSPKTVSRGAVMLAETGETATAIARRLGVTRPAVSNWLRGDKIPDASRRRVIAELYSIPNRAWGLSADGGDLEAEGDETEHLGALALETNREGAERLLAEVVERKAEAGLLPVEYIRFIAEETKVRSLIAKMDDADRMTETRMAQHPWFGRFLARVTDAMRDYPEALEALVAVLESMTSEDAER